MSRNLPDMQRVPGLPVTGHWSLHTLSASSSSGDTEKGRQEGEDAAAASRKDRVLRHTVSKIPYRYHPPSVFFRNWRA